MEITLTKYHQTLFAHMNINFYSCQGHIQEKMVGGFKTKREQKSNKKGPFYGMEMRA